MDVARTPSTFELWRRRVLVALVSAVVVALAFLGFQSRHPSIERSSVVLATVQRGPLVREVHGRGTFFSEHVQVVVATVPGRVGSILQTVGASVSADTPLATIVNQEAVQAEADARLRYEAAVARLASVRAAADAESLSRQSALQALLVDQQDAQLRAEIAAKLTRDGIGSALDQTLLERRAENLRGRYDLEQRRVRAADRAAQQELLAESAGVEQLRAMYALKKSQAEGLVVRAGAAGVLQQLVVQPGQALTAGAPIGRVVDPRHLKVRVAVAAADARLLRLGLPASVDTGSGKVAGRVTRIDPAVADGNVSLDIELLGPPPAGVRPDLSVQATIQVERLASVLKVAKPAMATGDTARLFVVEDDHGVRVPVTFGRSSLTEIEIVAGLNEGDRVIVAEPDRLEAHDRVVLK